MKKLILGTVMAFAASGSALTEAADCRLRDIAGSWVFATGVGGQNFAALNPEFPIPVDKAITALGTMNISRDGYVSGKFSVVFEDVAADTSPTYTGSIVVNKDCTAQLSFVSSTGAERIDALAIVDRSEMLGMSLDPNNLWTYQVRRISPSLTVDRGPLANLP